MKHSTIVGNYLVKEGFLLFGAKIKMGIKLSIYHIAKRTNAPNRRQDPTAGDPMKGRKQKKNPAQEDQRAEGPQIPYNAKERKP